jgi:hypothetical protein
MRRLILAWMMCAAWALKSMATKANVLGRFGGAAPGVIVTILCLISVADAQTVAPLRLTVPEEHPRIGITAADLDRVRGNLDKEPWAGLWKRILAKSEWVLREIKDGELLVTVSRGGTKDELVVTAGPSGGIATLRVARTADGKTVAENLKVK